MRDYLKPFIEEEKIEIEDIIASSDEGMETLGEANGNENSENVWDRLGL